VKAERITYIFGIVIVVGTFLFFASGVQSNNHPQPASPQLTANVVPYSPVTGKKLVFSDEFNGSSLNSNNWATCYDWRRPSETGCTNNGNFEQEWYNDDQVKVADGQLNITTINDPIDVSVQNQAKTFEYRSGMVNTGSGSTNGTVRWAGTYGYYEARMKFQAGQGVWPAFWLLPVNKQWPPEIDVMEFLGNKPNEILQTLHWQANGQPQESSVVIKRAQDYSNSWHTYGVDWEPGKIDWYIDGKLTRSYVGPNIPDTPMEIIINLAIGGLLPGNANTTTPFPSQLQVDFVRVYQADAQIRPHQY
jgi:beta-glucanase (GH16 family)